MWVPGEDFVDEFRLEWEESDEAEVFYKEQIKQQLKANAEAKNIEMDSLISCAMRINPNGENVMVYSLRGAPSTSQHVINTSYEIKLKRRQIN